MKTKEIKTIDPTIGSMVDECMRKVYWRIKRGVTPLWEPDYFVSGRAWDAMMGEWEKTEDEQACYAAAIRAMHKVYDTCNCENFNERRTPENLTSLFSLYVTQAEQKHYNVIDSNVGFEMPYKDFMLGGEIDRYLSWPPYGVVIDENKTTTVIPGKSGWDNYASGFDLGRYANQLTHYFWAVCEISEDVWGTRVMVACLDIPKRASTERTQFQPLWKPRNKAQVEDYLQLCEKRMADIRRAEKLNVWPKGGQHCTGGWGFSQCEYRSLCELPIPLDQIEIPEERFLVGEPWAPWDGIKCSADLERKEGKDD